MGRIVRAPGGNLTPITLTAYTAYEVIQMGDIIPFRERGCTLTDQELEEYYYIKQQINQTKTWREYFYCRRLVKEFRAKIAARYGLDNKK